MAKIYMGSGGFRGVSEIRQDRNAALRGMPQKKPLVYMGGGVSTHVVLASGGISRGGVVSVRSEGATSVKPRAKKPAVAVAAKPVLQEVKMVGKEARVIEPPKEEPKGLTETEKRAVEFFEAVEESRTAEERVPEECAAVDTKVEAAEAMPTEREEAKVEEPKAEMPTMAVIPELPLGGSAVSEEPTGGRRKRRRGKKNRAFPSTEVSEEKRQEFQEALEAASDAAASAG